MEPDITQEQAQQLLGQIRRGLRESGRTSAEADQYVQEVLGFPDYRSFVYFAANGMLPENDPDQALARYQGMSGLERFGTMALAGIPFSDEMAALHAAGRGGDYGAVHQGINETRNLIRREHPGRSFMAEMAGGIALPVGVGSMVGRAAARAGASPVWTAGKSLAAAGAAEGALFGASEGEGLGGRTGGAALGGLMGGAMGGGLGLLGGAVGRAGRRVAAGPFNFGRGSEARRSAGAHLSHGFMEQGGQDITDVQSALARYGDDAVVADASPVVGGGDIYTARGLGGGQLDAPGGPMSRLNRRSEERSDRLFSEILGAQDATGIPRIQSQRDLIQGFRDTAQERFYGPIDEAWDAFSLNDTPEILDFILRPDNLPGAQNVLGSLERPLRFSDIQQYREALRTGIKKAALSPDIGAKERAASRLEEFTDIMRRTFGDEVAQADELWARSISMQDAMEAGQKVATQRAGALQDSWQNLGKNNAEERMAFLSGVLDRYGETLGASNTGGAAGSKLVSQSRSVRNWLSEIFGEGAMARIDEAMLREQAFATTAYNAGGNSMTAGRLANKELMQEDMTRVGVNWLEWKKIGARILANLTPTERQKANLIGEALLSDNTDLLEELLSSSAPGLGRDLANLIGTAGTSTISRALLGVTLRDLDQ